MSNRISAKNPHPIIFRYYRLTLDPMFFYVMRRYFNIDMEPRAIGRKEILRVTLLAHYLEGLWTSERENDWDSLTQKKNFLTKLRRVAFTTDDHPFDKARKVESFSHGIVYRLESRGNTTSYMNTPYPTPDEWKEHMRVCRRRYDHENWHTLMSNLMEQSDNWGK